MGPPSKAGSAVAASARTARGGRHAVLIEGRTDMGERIGPLAPGYEADTVVLDGDPLTDLTAVRWVVFVMRGGVVYEWAGATRRGK